MLVQANKTLVILFNMQLELIPLLHQGRSLLTSACWLADLCQDLELPLMLTVHEKLGPLSQALQEVASSAHSFHKVHFDCLQEAEIASFVQEMPYEHYVLAGAESHVCLLHSAVHLKALGKQVFVLADLCSARSFDDHHYALKRLQSSDITLITQEMFFFECLRRSDGERYLPLAKKYLDGRYIR